MNKKEYRSMREVSMEITGFVYNKIQVDKTMTKEKSNAELNEIILHSWIGNLTRIYGLDKTVEFVSLYSKDLASENKREALINEMLSKNKFYLNRKNKESR